MAQSSYTSNLVLASLPAADIDMLLPHLRTVDLPQETVLFEAGDTIGNVVFLHAGIISLVVNLATGEMIECAMVGRESLVGGLAALDSNVSVSRAVMLIAGCASVVEAEQARRLADRSEKFRRMLVRHEHLILAQSQQSAACNAAHTLEARLSLAVALPGLDGQR
jgi:CRP-like cAMP-binding protein